MRLGSRLTYRTICASLLTGLGFGCGGSDDGGLGPPLPATHIAMNAGNNQTAVPGTSVAIAPSVKVSDANRNPVAGVAVTFAVALGGGAVRGAEQTTNPAGIATVESWTLGPVIGTNTLTASAPGLSGSPVTFTAIAEAPPSAFTAISAGGDFTCALTAAGAAYCWGSNSFGPLGDGTRQDRTTPVPVAGGLSFGSITSGGFQACGVIPDGRAYCWGDNRFGQLGDGTGVSRLTPVPVAGGLTFAALSASVENTCGVTTDGTMYCWGETDFEHPSPDPQLAPVLVASAASFSTAAAGSSFNCGLTSAGTAYCWGQNSHGQLGDGTTTARLSPGPVAGELRFTSLTAGWGGVNHSCAVTDTGAAYCWGFNRDGQLGDGSTTDRLRPVPVAGGLSFVQIEAGSATTCGITSEGAGYCWGDNTAGSIGDGTTLDRFTPVAVAGGLTFSAISAGVSHTCGIAAGEAYCWGTTRVVGEQHTPTLVER